MLFDPYCREIFHSPENEQINFTQISFFMLNRAEVDNTDYEINPMVYALYA